MKAERLRPGDIVGIVSPSWYGGESVAHRVERGIAQLKSLGFAVKIAPHALNASGYVSDTPEHRAADIHTMFADPGVRAIIATIGGDHSCHLLPLLDWVLLRANPKIFMGFSDITVLNVAIWSMTGLTTFNGPTLMTDWADYPLMPEYSEHYALRALCTAEPIGVVEPSPWWTDEFLDWSTKADLTRPREQRPSPGWTWLRGGTAEGILIGGCLESLQHLRGTRHWPDWNGALLFLETSEEKPSPVTVDAMLMDYENMGVLSQIRGLLVARPYGYSDEERAQLHEVIRERTRRYGFPIIADMDFGHTTPIFTLPIGCRASIDADVQRFTITEPAVR
jgi:muramoyltetrapeptide carboxypeptidase LdcA involved in peptidoglycan recycling